MRYRKQIALAQLAALILVPLFALSASRYYSAHRAAMAAGSEPAVIVIDPGHGGEDGGAVSCTGARESDLNLEVSLRLNDLLGLLGAPTKMTRTSDTSVSSQDAATVSEKKLSDLKNRVLLAEQTPGAILVSIHQNMFPEAKYRGAQVFYADTPGSRALAEALQDTLRAELDPANRRQVKQTKEVYLLKKVSCPAVLIECGFLSNPQEEQLLRDPDYQLRLVCCAAVSLIRTVSAQKSA